MRGERGGKRRCMKRKISSIYVCTSTIYIKYKRMSDQLLLSVDVVARTACKQHLLSFSVIFLFLSSSDFLLLLLCFTDSECAAGEFNCEDATCISMDLRCNKHFNCRFRWDEDNCDVSIITILTLFIVYRMMLS